MRHFNRSEYSHSDTAVAKGIENKPSEYQYTKFEMLVDTILDDLRDFLGEPITITSGFRDLPLNRLLGSRDTSHHVAHDDVVAVDIVCKDLDLAYDWIKTNTKYDQVILEKAHGKEWIHVSLRTKSNNRNMALLYDGRGYKIAK